MSSLSEKLQQAASEAPACGIDLCGLETDAGTFCAGCEFEGGFHCPGCTAHDPRESK